MKWILPFVIVILGMLGGQIRKQIRRYGIPFTAFLAAIFNKKDEIKERWKKAGLLLLFIAALSIGYGENSWLRGKLKYEWLTRLAFAILLSIPFLFLGNWWALPALVVAKQVRAGGFKLWGKDFLWEDLVVYSTLGILVSVLIYR